MKPSHEILVSREGAPRHYWRATELTEARAEQLAAGYRRRAKARGERVTVTVRPIAIEDEHSHREACEVRPRAERAEEGDDA